MSEPKQQRNNLYPSAKWLWWMVLLFVALMAAVWLYFDWKLRRLK